MRAQTWIRPALVLAFGLAGLGIAHAGPVGSGLGLTEATARKAYAERTVRVAVAHSACATAAAEAVRAHPAVSQVRADTGAAAVSVVFASKDHAREHGAAVRTLAAGACVRAG